MSSARWEQTKGNRRAKMSLLRQAMSREPDEFYIFKVAEYTQGLGE